MQTELQTINSSGATNDDDFVDYEESWQGMVNDIELDISDSADYDDLNDKEPISCNESPPKA